VINAIRELSSAEIKLSKDAHGNGTLQVQGAAEELDHVASLVQMVVTYPHADPDVHAMATGLRAHADIADDAHGGGGYGGGGAGVAYSGSGAAVEEEEDDEYVLPLAPDEARALDASRQLPGVMRGAGVRCGVDRSSVDGWVTLTIKGARSAIDAAKLRIEAIVTPADDGEGADDDANGAVSTAPPLPHSRGAAQRVHGDGPSSDLEPQGASAAGGFRIEIALNSKDQLDALVNAADGTLARIRASTDVTIQVESGRVVLVGPEADCLYARDLVHDALETGERDDADDAGDEKDEGDGTVQLTVPRHLVGRVIGKQGATIKRLRETTGAVIEMDKSASGVGTLTLAGPPSAVRDARIQIEELLDEVRRPCAPCATASRLPPLAARRTHCTPWGAEPAPPHRYGRGAAGPNHAGTKRRCWDDAPHRPPPSTLLRRTQHVQCLLLTRACCGARSVGRTCPSRRRRQWGRCSMRVWSSRCRRAMWAR
jgi:predicted RNA-binding protein YlqC (UPF0109 family)